MMNNPGHIKEEVPRILYLRARAEPFLDGVDVADESGDALDVQVLRSFADLPHIDTATSANPFTDLAWFRHLQDTTQIAHEDLRLYCVTRGDRHFILPMMGTQGGLAGAGVRCATGLANFYTPCFGPISNGDGEFQAQCIERIVATLSEETPAWEALLFQPLDAQGRFYAALQNALRQAGYLSDDFFSFGNWYLPAQGLSFDRYFAELPSVLRHTVERARRKLQNEGSRIEIFDGSTPGLEAAIAAFCTVYRHSWKRPEPYPRFVPGLCRMAAREGWLRLGLLYVGNRPAAAQIWLNTPRKASIYKLAYDERYARLSVGSVLSAAMFRHALDVDRVAEIDYLAGDDPYKSDWMKHRRERRGIVAFDRRKPRAVFAAARHFSGSWLNRLRDFAPGAKVHRLHEGRVSRDGKDVQSLARVTTTNRRMEA